jgi:MoaA/NifB/PqqE/SkfB family radical SAM enzyme
MWRFLQTQVLQNYSRYKLLERLYRRARPASVPARYPTDLNIELTSVCNAKCVFCTHETLVRGGLKLSKHMSLDFAKMVLDRLRALTESLGIPDHEIRLGPVGLGEPLLFPHFAEVVRYARELFPRAFIHANTNCLSLKGDRAAQLIDSGLDGLILSLCYNTPELYKERMGVDAYATVVKNIEAFLKFKSNRAPRTIIHIFDAPENVPGFPAFMQHWGARLNQNDFAGLYKYLPLTDWTPKPGVKSPCSQLWNVMMVDVDGFVYPCCIGVWTRKDDDLCLGHISDAPNVLLDQVRAIRARHIAGDFGICDGCGSLSELREENRIAYETIQKRDGFHQR